MIFINRLVNVFKTFNLCLVSENLNHISIRLFHHDVGSVFFESLHKENSSIKNLVCFAWFSLIVYFYIAWLVQLSLIKLTLWSVLAWLAKVVCHEKEVWLYWFRLVSVLECWHLTFNNIFLFPEEWVHCASKNLILIFSFLLA